RQRLGQGDAVGERRRLDQSLYNSQSSGDAATTLPCAFSVSHQPNSFQYKITLPFQVNSCFFSATIGENGPAGTNVFPNSTTQVLIITHGGFSDSRVYLLVF